MPLGAFKAALMATAGTATTGDVVLLASNSSDTTDLSSIDFTSGITSTYGEYIFKFYNINPATDDTHFSFQCNAAGASGYNETITSTSFYAYHAEADGSPALAYDTGNDQAEGTSYQNLMIQIGNGSDESGAGELHLFNPASTTYAKHWISETNVYFKDD